MNVREAAFLSLGKCTPGGKYSNLEVDSAIKKYGFTGSDRAFFTALVYGTIEKRITLDYVISRFSSKPPEKLEPKVLDILRLEHIRYSFSTACRTVPPATKAWSLQSITRTRERRAL